VIVVRVELWPLGDESRKRSLGTAFIVNDGTGTAAHGNYKVALMKMKDATQPWRLGRVQRWNRRGSPWDLLTRAIVSAVRNPITDHALRRDMVRTARRAMSGQRDLFDTEPDDERFTEEERNDETATGS
jgi:hypothetical protein